jgi:uncharacterized protein YrrD
VRKGKDLIGKQIVAYDSGKKIDTIKDLIFDQNENCVIGFLIKEAGWFSNAQILPLYLVKAIGNDVAIVPSRDAISPSIDRDNIHKVLQDDWVLNGTRIVTTDGRDLGKLIDFYFDEQTGIVEGYEVSGGIFADAYSGRSFVPATHALKMGKEVAFVSAETVGLMEEQIGGLQAALQTANNKIQATAQNAGAKLPTSAQSAGEQLPAAGRAAHARMADAVVERAQGRRSQLAIYTPDGYIIAAQGQIITHQAIERARANHQESALLAAVGLSPTEAVQSPAGNLATVAGTRLQTTTTNASEHIRSDATNLWEKVKATASDIQGRSTDALEEKRIRGALGRPTTRVILDRDDEVILNVGESINHRAIGSARSAGILDVLLDSVYTETPHLSIDELRAPGTGKSAL